MLLCLPLILAACEPTTEEAKKPVLSLTSEAELVFDNKDNGQIDYTLENAPEGALPTATCEANWVRGIKVEQSITFTVVYPEPYLSESDQTTIKVAYEDQSFEVTIKRNANAPEGPTYELSYIDGTYYGPGYWDVNISAHNFFVTLSSADNFSAYEPDSVYLTLDIFASEGSEAEPVIPNGTYTFNDSNTEDTIGCYYSYLSLVDQGGNPTRYNPVSGTVTVSDNKIEGYFVDEEGNTHKFIYTGAPALPVVEKSDIELNGTGYTCYVENYGDYYSVGADNYLMTMIEDSSTNSGVYFIIDTLVDPAATSYNGEYTVLIDQSDLYSKFIAGYINEGYLVGTWYAILEQGELTDIYIPIYSGTITITDNGASSKIFTFDCLDDKGYAITGSIEATVYESDAEAQAQSLGKSKIAAPAKGFATR